MLPEDDIPGPNSDKNETYQVGEGIVLNSIIEHSYEKRALIDIENRDLFNFAMIILLSHLPHRFSALMAPLSPLHASGVRRCG